MIKVLRAKNGSHVYHIVGKKRGKLLVKNPADDLLPVEMTQEQVDAIAVPAWEFDDDLMNAALELSNQLVIRGLVENGYKTLHGNIWFLIEKMREARLEGARDER